MHNWSTALGPLYTAIGSTPHHNVDSALECSFQWSIPFLPQIPVRNPKEFMIYQALEGMPGLQLEDKGQVTLDRNVWLEKAGTLTEKLEEAFRSNDSSLFYCFEPSADSYNCWKPFLWELQERHIGHAKIQIAGPMTSQWVLRLQDGTPADKYVEISMQIFRLVLAKTIAMVRRLKAIGVTPLLYIDEPSLYCFSSHLPRHLMGLQELKVFIQSLKKEGAIVGLHCCSNTDWGAVLSLGLDVFSIDAKLSLHSILQHKGALLKFLQQGGRLSLGVVPTDEGGAGIASFDPEAAVQAIQRSFQKAEFPIETTTSILHSSIYTPVCGLALHRIEEIEPILAHTRRAAELAHLR